MRKILLLWLAVVSSAVAQNPAATSVSTHKYVKVPQGYFMVLKQGDDVFKELEKFAKTEKIPSAQFTGMGFAQRVTLGFYDFPTKKYEPKEFEKVEVANMIGSIAYKQNEVSTHMHCTVAGRDFSAHAGHALSATVGTGSLEIMIIVHDKTFERKMDPTIGANVLCLENCR